MKNYKTPVLLFIAGLFILTGFKKQNRDRKIPEAKWSGTVSFFEKKSGGEIAFYEWRMEATITNDTGTAVHTMKFSNTQGDNSYCRTAGKTELEVGVDEDAGEYGITVWVPGCYGRTYYHYGKIDSFTVTDETGIMINKQRLGANHNALSGRTRDVAGPDPSGCTTITIYEWDVKKTKN
jgi:hypothetical protein